MVRIGVISDIHMRNKDQEAVTQMLEQVVNRFNKEFSPDIVVILGDIIEHEDNVDDDRDNMRQVLDVLAGLDAPVRYMLGNHDVEHLSRDDIRDMLGQDLYGKETVGGETLLFLDSSAPRLSGSRGEVTPEQLSFLQEHVPGEQPFIFVHHPIHYRSLEDTYWWDVYPERAFCGNKKEINNILADHDVRLVVNGHIHEHYHTRYNGTDHVTVDAFNRKARDGVVGTYTELIVDDTETTVTMKQRDGTVNTWECS